MRKRIVEIVVLASFLATMFYISSDTQKEIEITEQARDIEVTQLPEKYVMLHHSEWDEEQEEIRNEITYGEIELLAQLVEAEAGNQDEIGKRYVADVVLNRVAYSKFPDTIEEVIFQTSPTQFSCVIDGNFDKAGWTVSEEDYQVALEEYTGNRLDTDIIYFRTDYYSESGKPAFKYGNHYFNK